jgi:TolB-like protein
MAGPLTKGRATNARNIGKELGVAYLLEGSVQKAGNRLRIIVLIETEGAHTSGVRASTAQSTISLISKIE